LERLPDSVRAPELADSVTRFRSNLARREEERAKRSDEVLADLDKAVKADNILDGLKSAIELQLLSTEKGQALARPEVRRMVESAATGSWRMDCTPGFTCSTRIRANTRKTSSGSGFGAPCSGSMCPSGCTS
ncbi:MAG: hypothetical protein CVV40_00360, partial [Planctomycetes bacterium HGW-Planctomycetes-2]